MTSPGAADTVVAASKAVIVMDHIKNNRVEYLVLAVLAHILGWTQTGMEYASGVCA
jgi:hypothetical protein